MDQQERRDVLDEGGRALRSERRMWQGWRGARVGRFRTSLSVQGMRELDCCVSCATAYAAPSASSSLTSTTCSAPPEGASRAAACVESAAACLLACSAHGRARRVFRGPDEVAALRRFAPAYAPPLPFAVAGTHLAGFLVVRQLERVGVRAKGLWSKWAWTVSRGRDGLAGLSG